jgi:hypothetical protein
LRRNCLLKHSIEGKIEVEVEVMERQWRRHKELLDDLKKWENTVLLKEEALDRTVRRTRFGKGYGHVVRRTAEWMNEWMNNISWHADGKKHFTACSNAFKNIPSIDPLFDRSNF